MDIKESISNLITAIYNHSKKKKTEYFSFVSYLNWIKYKIQTTNINKWRMIRLYEVYSIFIRKVTWHMCDLHLNTILNLLHCDGSWLQLRMLTISFLPPSLFLTLLRPSISLFLPNSLTTYHWMPFYIPCKKLVSWFFGWNGTTFTWMMLLCISYNLTQKQSMFF